jgi:hypothetical protein
MQILVAGQADFSMGYDFTVMKGIEQAAAGDRRYPFPVRPAGHDDA